MAVLGFILSLTILSLGHGMPTLLHSKEVRFPLQGFTQRLKASLVHHGKRLPHDMKYPVYMMHMYQNLMSGKFKDLSIQGEPALLESDTVLSLIAKGCTQVDNRWTLLFDMSSVSISSELRLAELRIHLPSFQRFQNVTLDIYHTKRNVERLFLGSVTIDSLVTPGSSWKVFNLTQMLHRYLYHKERISSDEYTDLLATSHEEQKCNGLLAERIMLVVFSTDRLSSKLTGSPSLIETVESSKYIITEADTRDTGRRRHRRNHFDQNSIIRSGFHSRPVGDDKTLCKRVDMIVDFEKIGWGDLIIYPKRFNAYRCEGSCPIPLDENFKPTNHAYIKSLVNFFNPKRVECPSCVPVKMRPLSMLMYEGDEIVLKHHEDMIVEECGCY
ncbi:nodal homolog 5 L homeolog precursor [Xenopus laevis]|uniref:Nodal homolog n=1 Tax=Xenopus laevis TaxID=8355 RepID=Q2PG66_XENLA|nr:nodal homolog 5 L homeolog precursor [Xenopus laevis]BAE72905.1 Xnr5-2 [Xenopus laevis]